MMTLIKAISTILIAITLTACGGGGGGGTGVAITPGPSGPSINGSISTDALSSAFTGAWKSTESHQTELNALYNVFNRINELQDDYNITASDLSNINGTVSINGTDYSAKEAWLIAVGFKNRYFDGKETLWKNVKNNKGFDDESTDYLTLNEVIKDDEQKLASADLNFYKQTGKDKEERTRNNVKDDVITWKVEYDSWVQVGTSSAEENCTVDIYTRNVQWRKYVNNNATATIVFKQKQTEQRNRQCVVPVTLTNTVETFKDTSTDTVSAVTDTSSTTVERSSADANGSTVTKTFVIYTDKTTTTTTTTTYRTTTTVKTYSNGTSTTTVSDPVAINTTSSDVITTATREKLTDTKVTHNVVSQSSSDSVDTSTSNGTSVTTTSYVDEDRRSTDANGSTVIKTYRVYTDTTTTPVTTTTTTTTTTTFVWSDGSTTNKVSDTSKDSTEDVVTTATREVLQNTQITANVVSTSDSDRTSTSSSNGDPVTTTTYTNEVRTSTDANGSTVLKTYRVYTDTTTTPVTTTTTVTTTRTTVWTDGSTTSEVISTSTSDSVSNTVTTANREELINTTVNVNVVSTTDSDSTSTSTSNGTATVNTTSTTENRTSTDANGSTVTKTYTIYTDTTTTPVTTTTTVTTTRTTLWTDGSETSEVINTTSSSSTSNTVTTANREELTNTVVTPNVASTATVYKNERTSTVEGELISELYGTNSDTITTGRDANGNPIYQNVTLYYYSWYKMTHTKTLKDKYTRTSYTDGSTNDVLVTADIETTTTPTKVYLLDPWGGKKTTTHRVPLGETFIGNPVAPGDTGGSSGVYKYDQRDANHNVNNYNTSSYYNDTNIGTPTPGVSNDPTSYETTEAENGATLVTYANHAYSRGWTGKGSTALIMDTGIDQDHPEFAGKIKYKWDAGYDTPYEDENGHGTHVAGIVSANKDGTGIHGVAFDADLAIAKIGERRGISLSGARQALNWAKQYDDIVVANLSANVSYSSSYKNAMTDQGNGIYTNNHTIYGGSNYYNLEDPTAWKDVIPDELVLVVSAGNSGLDYVQNPATFASAVDSNGNLELDGRMLVAGNWNTSTQSIDGAKSGHVCKDYTTQCNDPYKTSDFYILAPGTNINSTYNDGGYKRMSGTSMSAPAVTAGVSIVHQMWPYMKGSNIAQVLLQTADKNLADYNVNTHGQGLMDLDKATRPIGELGISTTGRTGTTASISGSISADGIDADVSSVSAVDSFDRDFTVDLSSMVNNDNTNIEQLRHTRGQSWAVKQANIETVDYQNFTLGTNNEDTYVLGYTHSLNNDYDLKVSYSKTKDNPWLSMSGVWGEVNSVDTIDTSITWSGDDLWAQAGVMHTNTEITKGLVIDVEDTISAYGIGGITLDDFTFYTGVKPKVIKGKIDLSIPNSVDSNGIMHYNSTSSKYGSGTVPFIGARHTYYFKEEDEDVLLNTDVVADAYGNHSFNVTFEYKF